jgi:hypothetical protein
MLELYHEKNYLTKDQSALQQKEIENIFDDLRRSIVDGTQATQRIKNL